MNLLTLLVFSQPIPRASIATKAVLIAHVQADDDRSREPGSERSFGEMTMILKARGKVDSYAHEGESD